MPRKTKIKLSDSLAFDTSVITEVIDLVAKRGSGKTYAATKLAEEMIGVGAQVVVIDPVGNWYGLRLGSDGKHSGGLDIKILGGRHGDIPLEHTAGKVVAKTIVETDMSVILDVSMLSKPKQRRFITDFSEALLEYRKRNPSAMHIFWEEAYRFMPQKQAKGSKNEMLEATEELVTMGRNFGIGGTIICQRSAQISKTALTQAGILLAMNTTGLADRKVIEAWVEYQSLEMKKLELSSLRRGEAYVWWPEEFGIKRIKVAKKKTYDASSTPKFGEKTKTRKLKEIDLDALSSAMAETVEKVKAEDPRALRRRIAELERELAMERNKDPEQVVVQVPAVNESDLSTLIGIVGDIAGRAEKARQTLNRIEAKKGNGKISMSATVVRTDVPNKNLDVYPRKIVRRAVHRNNVDTKLVAGALRMLKSLAAMHPGGLTKKQVAAAAGMKSTSGTYGTYWSKLVTGGFIEQRGQLWYATDAGIDYLGDDIPAQPEGPEEKVDFWCSKFPGRVQEILRLLFENSSETFSKEEIGEAVGLVHTSGTFGTYLSRLTSNNLVVKESGGYRISPDLMV